MRLSRAFLVLAVLALPACGGDAPPAPLQKTQIVLRIGAETLLLDKATVQTASIPDDCPAQPGSTCVQITLTDAGSAWFARITVANIGKSVDIEVNGEVVTRPVIRAPIPGGKAMLTNIPEEHARRFIESLR